MMFICGSSFKSQGSHHALHGRQKNGAFGAGLHASGYILSGTHANYMVSPVDALLPNVNPELQSAYLEA